MSLDIGLWLLFLWTSLLSKVILWFVDLLLNSFIFLLLSSDLFIKLLYLILGLLEPWAGSEWRRCTVVVDVDRDVVEGFHMGWLERVVNVSIKTSTSHCFSKFSSIFSFLFSLSSLVSDFDAPSNLALYIFVVVASSLSDFLLVLSLQLNNFHRLGNDGWLLEIFDILFSNSIGVSQFINCLDVLISCILL